MSISDGVNANAANFNSSFVSKTDTDSKGGDLTLNDKLSLQDSGSATMIDAQQEINDLKDEFNSSTGHDHDGVDSKKVVATNLDGTGGANGQVLKADGAGNVLWDTDEGTGAINYIGAWNANTNSPALASGAGTKGDYYVINVAGTTTLDGISDWENTDWAVFNGTVWEKVDNTDQVLSVAGKQGAVVLDSDDVAETASKKWAFKSNLTTSDPTTTDDSASGYSVGSRWWNSSSDTLFICEDNTASAAVWKGVSGGTGGGGLDVYLAEDFETTVAADFTSGNNATFDNGGTLQGALADETTNPIAGDSCLKYTQAAGSLNDFIKSPVINIDEKQAGNYTGMTLYFTYDGDADDIKVIFYDETNSEVLTDSVDLLSSESNPTRYSTSVFIPEGVTQVAYGFQVAVENSTKILLADDVELTTNPFVYKNLIDRQEYKLLQAPTSMTNATAEIEFNLGTATITNSGPNIISAVDDSGNTRTKFIANRRCTVDVNFAGTVGTVNRQVAIAKNGVVVAPGTESTQINRQAGTAGTVDLEIGDYFTVAVSVNNVTIEATSLTGSDIAILQFVATAETEHVITPAKSNMTDWTSYTPTFIGFGTPTNVEFWHKRVGDSVLLRGRFTSGTSTATTATATLPAGLTIDTNKIDTANASNNGYYFRSATASASGGAIILQDSDLTHITFGSVSTFDSSSLNPLSQANGNSVAVSGESITLVTAAIPIEGWDSDATFLAAIPTQLTAYIKDLKADDTDGGTFTSSAWQTRDLNAVEGDTEFISLSSSQFTLSSGKYLIEGSAPAYKTDQHQTRIRNITDSTDLTEGTSENSSTIDNTSSRSNLAASVTLNSSKTFEIQHHCETTKSGNGFGVSAPTAAIQELYTMVKITKVK